MKEIAGKKIKLKFVSADLAGMFRQMTDRGVIFYDIFYENDLTAYAEIKKSDFPKIQKLLQKRGEEWEIVDKYILYGLLYMLKRRYILVFGIAFLLFLTWFVPSRVLFIQVKGNQKISTQYIVEKAVENGITFGCDRWQLRSAQLKNRILEDIPELDWVGVTTAGCVATVEVKEKEIPKTKQEKNFCSIVAVTDGVVQSVTVTKGNAVCVPGQAVREGQLLISGYVDQGLLIKATGAEGEIHAKTFRRLKAVSPDAHTSRGEIQKKTVKYSVQMGKKVLNFSKHSSISPPSCVKIYTKEYMTLPGGYILPIAIIREETVYYETKVASQQEFTWLEDAAKQYLKSQMIAGEILENTTECHVRDDLCILTGFYTCTEQIGKYQFEEIPINNGENS